MNNLEAFLATVRHSEGTDGKSDPYAVTFGDAFTIQDFSDHPHALGWPGYLWKGIHETAAGAYQIIYPTWLRLKAKLGLIDFSPSSQDAAACELIREVDALDLINEGHLAAVIARCSSIWASLPGSTSGQPEVMLASLIDFYTASGGIAV